MKTSFLEAMEKRELILQKAIQVKRSYDSKKGVYDSDLVGQLLSSIAGIKGNSFVKKGNKVSFRTAAIVVVEESLIRTNSTRDILKYSLIINQTKVQFKTNISNRNISNFPTIEDIHPKDPCLFYDSTTSDEKLNRSNRAKKGNYKNSLEKIISGKDWMLSLNKAEERISSTLSEIKLC